MSIRSTCPLSPKLLEIIGVIIESEEENDDGFEVLFFRQILQVDTNNPTYFNEILAMPLVFKS